MADRGHRHRTASIARLLALVIVVGTSLSTLSSAAGAAASDSALGTKNPAKGTPVKIGFVTNDKNSTSDVSIETPVANAAAEWLNAYMNGVGGHPIDLDRCVDLADAGKATDCANQMIRDKVAAVVIGSNAVSENVWTPLHAAGIPVFLYGAGNTNIVADATSTFVATGATASLVALPAGVAKQQKVKKVTIIAIDVPAATSFYKDPGPTLFKQQGLTMNLVPVTAGTADMTPQMQEVTTNNPKGVVFVIGNDAFCIAAFNGLRTAGFKGTVTSIPQCISDATRTAVPGDFMKGIRIAATTPIDTPKDPVTKQYYAVVDKYGASDVDKSDINGQAIFMALSSLSVATQGLTGEATPASIIAATKAMPWSVLPGSGLHFRCNGQANPTRPADCGHSTLAATLNAEGKATSYVPVGDTKIPD